MPTDRLVQECALVLVNLRKLELHQVHVCKEGPRTFGRIEAISWLPVTDKAKSTIMALRPL